MNSVGTLTTRLAEESNALGKAFGDTMDKQVQLVAVIVIGIALGFYASWRIAFVCLACFPLTIMASAVQIAEYAGSR